MSVKPQSLNSIGSLPSSHLINLKSNLPSLSKPSLTILHKNTNNENFDERNSSKISSEQRIRPIRFLLKYSPPQIVIHYEDLKYNNKLREKTISIDQIGNNKITSNQLQDILLKTHKKYFSPSLISLNQLQRLINKLISASRAQNNTIDLDGLYGNSIEEEQNLEDLNKVSESELYRRKNEMSIQFEKKRIKPTDENYIYDKRVEFDQKETEPSEWD